MTKEEMIKEVFDYIRFGAAGYYVSNDENGRKIERKSNRIDTLFTDCRCYETGLYCGDKAGMEAAEWVCE